MPLFSKLNLIIDAIVFFENPIQSSIHVPLSGETAA
jgi:hypothetical protein